MPGTRTLFVFGRGGGECGAVGKGTVGQRLLRVHATPPANGQGRPRRTSRDFLSTTILKSWQGARQCLETFQQDGLAMPPVYWASLVPVPSFPVFARLFGDNLRTQTGTGQGARAGQTPHQRRFPVPCEFPACASAVFSCLRAPISEHQIPLTSPKKDYVFSLFAPQFSLNPRLYFFLFVSGKLTRFVLVIQGEQPIELYIQMIKD